MNKMDLLYEGKAKKGTIVGKGVNSRRMCNHVLKILKKEGVPNHLIKELSDRETAVKKVDIVPLEVIIRNVAAGSFSERMGIEEAYNGVFKRLGYRI